MLAALFTAGFFMLLTVKAGDARRCLSGALALATILIWMWDSDPKPLRRAEIGHGIKLPTYVSGPLSHSWWAMVVLMLVAGSLYLAFVFSYLYLWTVSPQVWPRPAQLAAPLWPMLSALLLAASSGLIALAGRLLPVGSRRNAAVVLLIAARRRGARRRIGDRDARALARRTAPRRGRACRDGLHGVAASASSWCWRSS